VKRLLAVAAEQRLASGARLAVTPNVTGGDTVKTLLPAILVPVLVLLSACAPKVNDPADVQAVKQTLDAYTKAINAKDTAASVAMMTDRTAYFEPHMPAITGKDAVAKFHQMLFDQFDIEMRPVVTDVQVEGNLAIMRGTHTNRLVPKAEGAAAMPDSGNWTVAARRQADGSWKWDWIMGASDQPMPGTTADGVEENVLMQLEHDWAAAIVRQDAAALDRILAKAWAYGADDAEVMTRAQLLSAVKSGAFKLESARLHDLNVHVFGDAAIATMSAEIKGTFMGKPYPSGSSTDLFVKRGGRWQAVSSQNRTINP
jgi:ketosteroid isomerase-like protein